MRSLALSTAVLLSFAPAAAPGARAQGMSVAVQDKKLEAGKAAFERLRQDPRRRRYRDAWEAVLRELDAAVKAAPSGPRAAEAALLASRARVELCEVSRAPADVQAALAALRKVDQDHPGAAGLQALLAAVNLSWHSKEPGLRAAAAKRLIARYPSSSEARAVSERSAAMEKSAIAGPPAPPASKVTQGAPVEVGDSDEDDQDALAAATSPETPPARAAAAPPPAPRVASPAPAALLPAAAPAGPAKEAAAAAPGLAREPELDVGREAAQVIEEMVQDARARQGAREGGAAAALGQVARGAGDAEAGKSPAATPPAALSGEAGLPEPEAPEIPKSRSGPLAKAVKDVVAHLTEPQDEPDSAARARELRSTAMASGSSIAAQLGLKIRRVVVDAGHGGKDTGAIGPHGVREKDLALAIARKVAAQLRAIGLTVVMTRSDDTFIPLDDRTRIANEARADLFVSIHCNAARRRSLAGIETWTLNVASDHYAARLAAFENAEADRTVSDLRMILADLATKANAGDARELAQAVQASLVRTLRSRVGKVTDHGVKQALFYVLLGAHMPSILVETGFISNPAEESRLKSPRFQDGAAEAIARGVKDFVDGRRKIAQAP